MSLLLLKEEQKKLRYQVSIVPSLATSPQKHVMPLQFAKDWNYIRRYQQFPRLYKNSLPLPPLIPIEKSLSFPSSVCSLTPTVQPKTFLPMTLSKTTTKSKEIVSGFLVLLHKELLANHKEQNRGLGSLC